MLVPNPASGPPLLLHGPSFCLALLIALVRRKVLMTKERGQSDSFMLQRCSLSRACVAFL